MTRRKPCELPHSGCLRLYCPLPALFALAVLLALDGTGVLRIGLLCAALHESGHLLAYCLLLQRLPVVELRPTGLCMRMRGVWLQPVQELWLTAAGPLVNLGCCLAALATMQGAGRIGYAGYWFASANLLLGAFNLLPLPGLDGERLLTATAALLRGLQFGSR